jgi:hypothetical protein
MVEDQCDEKVSEEGYVIPLKPWRRQRGMEHPARHPCAEASILCVVDRQRDPLLVSRRVILQIPDEDGISLKFTWQEHSFYFG